MRFYCNLQPATRPCVEIFGYDKYVMCAFLGRSADIGWNTHLGSTTSPRQTDLLHHNACMYTNCTRNGPYATICHASVSTVQAHSFRDVAWSLRPSFSPNIVRMICARQNCHSFDIPLLSKLSSSKNVTFRWRSRSCKLSMPRVSKEDRENEVENSNYRTRPNLSPMNDATTRTVSQYH